MTYAELDRRSNALAWLLRRRGVGTDTRSGSRSSAAPDLVAALLAVLKAGGAYLPIELGTPAPRIATMIAAAGARLVLVTAETAAAVPQLARRGNMVRARQPEPPAGRPIENAPHRRTSRIR